MIFLVIILMTVSFIAGCLTPRFQTKKTKLALVKSLKDEADSNWSRGWEDGWKGASNDAGWILMRYEHYFKTEQK